MVEAEQVQHVVEAKSSQPFDRRTEVSADAKAIIQRLTLLLLWIPLAAAVIVLIFWLLTSH